MESLPPLAFRLYITVIIYLVLGLGFILLLFIYVSNPFRRLTIVKAVFTSALINDTLFLFKNGTVIINNGPLYRLLSWVKAGAHIVKNAFIPAPGAKADTIPEIISAIHELRFDTETPYLISGDHFSMFYPRNLGIFYFCLLDPRVALDEEDWIRREKKYLQSTAYALEVFSKAGDCSTTIVPTGRRSVTMINVFAYPSDTLYGILHALESMKSSQFFLENYPFESAARYKLHTQDAAEDLIRTYGIAIKQLYARYRRTVYDEKTGFIRAGVKLSSHLDTKMRSGAFYDNVVFWRTTQLVSRLGIVPVEESWLLDYKNRIIDEFWNEAGGFFFDDQSPEARARGLYASDWPIVLTTGFMNPLRVSEAAYFRRIAAFVRDQGLNRPFPLKVLGSLDKEKDHFWVRTFVPDYQDSAIWSNLGQQYIKTLLLLHRATQSDDYLREAKEAIEAYKSNMLRYRGYPEVYDHSGRMLTGMFYRSIRQTSWVVDFEHTLALYDAYSSASA